MNAVHRHIHCTGLDPSIDSDHHAEDGGDPNDAWDFDQSQCWLHAKANLLYGLGNILAHGCPAGIANGFAC
jgi:hypothetical protein